MEEKASLQNLLFSYEDGGTGFQSCQPFCDPMDCSPPGSPVHGILRQEYWRGLPCPSVGDLPDQGLSLVSPALQVGSSPLIHQGSLT